MHSIQRISVVVLIAGLAAACAKSDDTGDASELTTDQQKFGYSIGVNIGKSFKPVKDEFDFASFVAGLRETLDGKPPRLSDEVRQQLMSDMMRKAQQKAMEERLETGKLAKAAGEKFLADNGKREGVKTTASGLQYEMLQEGSGAKPKATDTVKAHYRGTLIDGKEFDSSYTRGQPASFPLGEMIPAWTEGLQLMKVGGKMKLYVPAHLAYGERGAGTIGPNETLIFEIELLGVEKAPAPKAPAKKGAK